VRKGTFTRVDNSVYYSPRGECFCPYQGTGPNGKHFSRRVTLDEWRRMGLDAHTQLADPLFVDREHHDYRLKPDSPALALGFQPIDTSEIGLREDFPYRPDETRPRISERAR